MSDPGTGDRSGTATGPEPGAAPSVRMRRERRPGRVRRTISRGTTFYRQVVAELRKVIWPTRRDLVTYTAVVLVFVLFMVAIVALFDFAASQAVLEVFGDSDTVDPGAEPLVDTPLDPNADENPDADAESDPPTE